MTAAPIARLAVSARTLLDGLRSWDWQSSDTTYWDVIEPAEIELREALAAVEALPDVATGGWISVNDRLPEKWHTQVLLNCRGSLSLGEWVRHPTVLKPCFQCECGWFPPENFIAWMPVSALLPPPPGENS